MQLAARPVDISVRTMIDEYLAAGLHTRLPTNDARLKPTPNRLDWATLTPHATASSVVRKIRETKDRSPVAHENWPPLTSMITAVGPCPSAPGSSRAARFEIMKVGATLAQLKEHGLRLSDLTRYLGNGVVTIEIPSET